MSSIIDASLHLIRFCCVLTSCLYFSYRYCWTYTTGWTAWKL